MCVVASLLSIAVEHDVVRACSQQALEWRLQRQEQQHQAATQQLVDTLRHVRTAAPAARQRRQQQLSGFASQCNKLRWASYGWGVVSWVEAVCWCFIVVSNQHTNALTVACAVLSRPTSPS